MRTPTFDMANQRGQGRVISGRAELPSSLASFFGGNRQAMVTGGPPTVVFGHIAKHCESDVPRTCEEHCPSGIANLRQWT